MLDMNNDDVSMILLQHEQDHEDTVTDIKGNSDDADDNDNADSDWDANTDDKNENLFIVFDSP